jgi:hypothetical protein
MEYMDKTTEPAWCAACGHELMPPTEPGQPGDDSYYCEGCGLAWDLDLREVVL